MENHELNQQAFDKVVRHLLKQGEKSGVTGADGWGFKCLYRGPGGMSCAIGCLIPDAEYDSLMDSCPTGITRLLSWFKPPSLQGLDFDMLASLQRIHDGFNPASWRSELWALAVKLGLTMPDLGPSP